MPSESELERGHREAQGVADIVQRFRRLPVLDDRQPEEIIGYDEHGLPAPDG